MSALDALPPGRGPGDVPVAAGARRSASDAVAADSRWSLRQTGWSPILLLAPACLLFATFVVYPILASIRLSLFDWDGIGARTWVGLGNYRELLADPVFHTALANNLWWLLLFMLAPASGLACALLLNQQVRGITHSAMVQCLPSRRFAPARRIFVGIMPWSRVEWRSRTK
jgi:multiple sugar transport system permease protein